MKNMVHYELSSIEEDQRLETADVCIIGAGAVGIYLAVRLAACGISVLLIEAGSRPNMTASDIGFVTRHRHDLYDGAVSGRAFGLGGSTSRWGGLLVPHTGYDTSENIGSDFDSSWTSIVARVNRYSSSVLQQLGYPNAGDFELFARQVLGRTYNEFHSIGIGVLASLFLPLSKKNLSFLFHRQSSNSIPVRLCTGAVAKTWHFEGTSHNRASVRQLTAVAENGKCLQVIAGAYVLAAGALESARILLEIHSLGNESPFPLEAEIGCYLADHLSVSIANVSNSDLDSVRRRFAPRFDGPWMRTFRFIETNRPVGCPRAFAHFIFENGDSGFQVAKEVLAAIQGRRRPRVGFSQVASGVLGLAALAEHRYLRSRLYVPPGTPTHLQLDVEQLPDRSNRILLSEELDKYGRPVIEIDWRITESDLQNIQSISERLLQMWSANPHSEFALEPLGTIYTGPKPHDAYHPVGVCQMGTDSRAILDLELKVKGTSNMWVVSTGALPSAGTANPTFTILCLAERLADKMSRNLTLNCS